jgi:hypothetical protein
MDAITRFTDLAPSQLDWLERRHPAFVELRSIRARCDRERMESERAINQARARKERESASHDHLRVLRAIEGVAG